MLVSFWYCYEVHTITVYSCFDCSCHLVHALVVGVNPKVRSVNLPPRSIFSSLTPPVFSLFIVSYFQYSHPRKMGSRHHIGKRRIFVGRRDCRSAFVLCLRDRSLFFAYPVSGGVILLILIFYTNCPLSDMGLDGMQKAISLKEKYPLPLSPTICMIMYFIIIFNFDYFPSVS